MDYLVIIIIVIIIIVIGYILSRPFVRSNAAPGTPFESKKPSSQSDDPLTKMGDPERTTSIDTHPGGDITPK